MIIFSKKSDIRPRADKADLYGSTALAEIRSHYHFAGILLVEGHGTEGPGIIISFFPMWPYIYEPYAEFKKISYS